MYRDDWCILSLVISCFGIINTSVQNFGIRISSTDRSVKTVPKCFWDLKVFLTHLIYIYIIFIDVFTSYDSHCQKYFGNHVISSQIHLFAPLLEMRHCTLWQRTWRSSLCFAIHVESTYKTWPWKTISQSPNTSWTLFTKGWHSQWSLFYHS